MKKKIYVFIGDPETGKSSLARLCVEPNTKVLDDIWNAPAAIGCLVNHIEKETIDWAAHTGYKHYTSYILICHSETSNMLLDALREAQNNERSNFKDKFDISVVRFERL